MTATSVTHEPGNVPVSPRSGTLTPLGLDEVRITGGFWADMQGRNRLHTIPHILSWLEKAGWLGNFDAALTGTLPQTRRGREFSDSEVYKLLEAMAWQLSVTPDPELETSFHGVVTRVAAAQEPDGYLNTRFGRPGQGARYSDLEWGHELYCYGHLLQAAAARLRTGNDDRLVAVGRAVADHICDTFGPDGIASVCGHAEVEMALVEFGRATGTRRYVDQASLFVERRGHQVLRDIEWGRSYYQDDLPFREAKTLRGHAVRALYLASGAVDVAIELGDDSLLEAAAGQLRHAVARRTYLTGGMGSQHQDEAFGEDFALPPDRAYAETCAGVASVMLSWRLLLATGETGYADLAERTLYNVVAASPGTDGREFFYTNTLHQRSPGFEPDPTTIVPRATSSLRAPWFEVSCCPPNVARTLASLGGYLATRDAQGVQLHQYADARISTRLDDGRQVQLTVETAYPEEGRIRIRSTGDQVGEWTLTLRVPAWAEQAQLTTPDGRRAVPAGPVTVTRDFRPGDVVELDLPVQPRFSFPDARIDAVRGCVAVERGPLVLCAESVDLPDGVDLADVRLDPATSLDDRARTTGTPGPWVTAHGVVSPGSEEPWPYRQRPGSATGPQVPVPLLPYHLWANRGPSEMRVWLPVADRA